MNKVLHDEFPLLSPPPRSESAARRHRGTAAANTTHRELSAFHANAAAQRLIYDTPHGMHAAHAHARLTLRGGFERRCWAPAARRVTVGAGSYMHASRVQRAADSVPRTTAATTHRRPREQTCNGALRARGGAQQTGKRAAQRGQDGALASRVAPCVYALGRRGGGGRHHAWLTAQHWKLAQRQVEK